MKQNRTKNSSTSRRIRWSRISLITCVMMIPTVLVGAAGFILGEMHGSAQATLTQQLLNEWRDAIKQQEQEVVAQKQNLELSLELLATRIADVQARSVRLDALGERLVSSANFDEGEFSFFSPPAIGGPEESTSGHLSFISSSSQSISDLTHSLDMLNQRLVEQERQLEIMETLISDRKLTEEEYIEGSPVKKGWLSSHYGNRIDPFNGKVRWHSGLDFAAKEGSDVVAVASGVVTWSGERYGYGNMVEINHGNGYATRYAHNKKDIVKVGQLVKKGQAIAIVGSSGRSTGPHVHFEVYKNGRTVDPSSYIHRTSR